MLLKDWLVCSDLITASGWLIDIPWRWNTHCNVCNRDMRCVGIWRLVGHKGSLGRLPFLSRSCGTKPVSALQGRVDRYNGIHVDIGAADVPTNEHFLTQLKGIGCVLRTMFSSLCLVLASLKLVARPEASVDSYQCEPAVFDLPRGLTPPPTGRGWPPQWWPKILVWVVGFDPLRAVPTKISEWERRCSKKCWLLVGGISSVSHIATANNVSLLLWPVFSVICRLLLSSQGQSESFWGEEGPDLAEVTADSMVGLILPAHLLCYIYICTLIACKYRINNSSHVSTHQGLFGGCLIPPRTSLCEGVMASFTLVFSLTRYH